MFIAVCALPSSAAADTGTASSEITGQDQDTPQALNREEVVHDLQLWLEWSKNTHPDLAYSVDMEELERVAASIQRDLPSQMRRQDAWKYLARLNPVLNDAHLGIVVPEAGPATDGAPSISVERVNEGLKVIDGTDDFPAGAIITEISGQGVAGTLDELVSLTRGESDALRRRIADLRLDSFVAFAFGEIDDTLISVRQPDGSTSTHRLSVVLQSKAANESAFALDWRDDTAVLRIPTFQREREAEFAAFLAESFAEIARRGADTLVIDLRDNGGGARELSDRLMAYLTTEPYSPISAVAARITPENQAMVPGSKLGDAIKVPFKQIVTPPASVPDRFDGEVLIATGPATYSQAIVFAATATDHGIASLCGAATDAPANQTGQVQVMELPSTGFSVRAPIYVFYRASGDRSRSPLVPDRSCSVT